MFLIIDVSFSLGFFSPGLFFAPNVNVSKITIILFAIDRNIAIFVV